MPSLPNGASMAGVTDKDGPLTGVRIIDLTSVVMGPMASRILGDLGADVIKVEGPTPDFMREFEPKRSPGMSGFTLNLNRQKRSVQLDLKTELGKQALLDLVAAGDVFVSNMRPAALARLGLGPDAVRALKPDIIYCSAVGFGTDGPYGGRAAYDDVIQAASGLASMFSWQGDDAEPAFMPSIVADKITALHIVYAINAALYRKATTGEGDHIEVPMAESLATFNLVEHLNGHTFEPKEEPFSYQRLRTKNRRPRQSADGWICLMPYTDANYVDFFNLVGEPDLASDPRFTTVNGRIDHVDELYGLVDKFAATKTTAEWMEVCEAHSIPCIPVVDLEHIEDDPHYAAVGLVEVAEHPTEGAYRVVRDPVRFESRPWGDVKRHAPRVGQHTAEVLADIGWSPEEIEQLA